MKRQLPDTMSHANYTQRPMAIGGFTSKHCCLLFALVCTYHVGVEFPEGRACG
ncbi:hypothetical protein Micbo1qcDRAFT_156885 [Microdochium bolleyi]|uniref:Uncharacterized protein n=1 Tax=Microdochium bolleyi TaxID=196109 RepID=A0A136JD48_9PEZI|nr:hypothetical protein Micbo1qcDRAFT_156885 [Microdochium bolleyi]